MSPKIKVKIGKSCLTCRKKKIKCGREKPACSFCQKHNQSHLCYYDSTPKTKLGFDTPIGLSKDETNIPSLVDSDELFELSSLLSNDTATITFKGNDTDASVIDNREGNSPFSWNSLIANDPVLAKIYQKINIKKLLDLTRTPDDPHNNPIEFDGLATNDCLDYEKNIGLANTSNSDNGAQVSRLFEASQVTNVQIQLNTMILKLLPDLDHVWCSINYFFRESHLHGFAPFIDENSFRTKISMIVGRQSDNHPPKINISRKLDYAAIGELLIILRLTYIYSKGLSEDNSNKTDTENKILEKPMTIEIVKLAHICQNQFCLFRRISIEVLQFVLFIRLYHYLAPEDGDGVDGGDSQTHVGLFLQGALSIGLDRSPTLTDFTKHPKLSNIWQKMWFQIRFLDHLQVVFMGNPAIVTKEYRHNQISQTSNNLNANNNDLSLESEVNTSLKRIQGVIDDVILPLSKLLMDLNVGYLPLNEVTDKITTLDRYITESKDIFTNESSSTGNFSKVYSLMVYLELQCLKFSIYYRIYLCMAEDPDSFPILKKLLVIITTMKPFFEYLNPSKNEFEDKFGKKASVTPLMPILQNLFHKIMLFEVSFLFRLLAIKKSNDENSISSNVLIDGIIDHLLSQYRYKVEIFSKLANTYYYSWTIAKTNSVILSRLLKNGNLSLFRKESVFFKNLTSVLNLTGSQIILNLSHNQLNLVYNVLKGPIEDNVLLENSDSFIIKNSPNILWNSDLDFQWMEQVFTYSPYNVSNDEITNFMEILNNIQTY